jgi:hypothetical protein
MLSRTAKLVLLPLAVALALVLSGLTRAIRQGSSGGQQGAMHDCPQAGKRAMSVRHGDDGTHTGEAQQ